MDIHRHALLHIDPFYRIRSRISTYMLYRRSQGYEVTPLEPCLSSGKGHLHGIKDTDAWVVKARHWTESACHCVEMALRHHDSVDATGTLASRRDPWTNGNCATGRAFSRPSLTLAPSTCSTFRPLRRGRPDVRDLQHWGYLPGGLQQRLNKALQNDNPDDALIDELTVKLDTVEFKTRQLVFLFANTPKPNGRPCKLRSDAGLGRYNGRPGTEKQKAKLGPVRCADRPVTPTSAASFRRWNPLERLALQGRSLIRRLPRRDAHRPMAVRSTVTRHDAVCLLAGSTQGHAIRWDFSVREPWSYSPGAAVLSTPVEAFQALTSWPCRRRFRDLQRRAQRALSLHRARPCAPCLLALPDGAAMSCPFTVDDTPWPGAAVQGTASFL